MRERAQRADAEATAAERVLKEVRVALFEDEEPPDEAHDGPDPGAFNPWLDCGEGVD